jgi:hypothetical protein
METDGEVIVVESATPRNPYALQLFEADQIDSSIDGTRDGKKSMCSHTNIHKGGFGDTFSEGCQTIYPTQYAEFIRNVYIEMTRAAKKTIEYVLVNNE